MLLGIVHVSGSARATVCLPVGTVPFGAARQETLSLGTRSQRLCCNQATHYAARARGEIQVQHCTQFTHTAHCVRLRSLVIARSIACCVLDADLRVCVRLRGALSWRPIVRAPLHFSKPRPIYERRIPFSSILNLTRHASSPRRSRRQLAHRVCTYCHPSDGVD